VTKEEDFNIFFTKANAPFFMFILNKYKDKLPYRGRHQDWAQKNNYCDRAYSIWTMKGRVSPRAVNMLHKDLSIIRQKDPTVKTIPELYKEFLES
jgi:hypothetical protein